MSLLSEARKASTPEGQLEFIKRAWGRNRGYVFFPYIDRKKQEETGLRRAGYEEGPAFLWPRDKPKIIAHLKKHRDKDVYWCPVVFEKPERKTDHAMEEFALWADLDEADPRKIDSDYQPTVAWETSPGRYQALWLIKNGDMLGASWPGNENQQLSYYVGADKSGWDTTQLLRIPGWPNYKPEYRVNGKAPKGKVLWHERGFYQPTDFEDLPRVEGALRADQITDVLEVEIENVDRASIIDRFKLRLNQRARELLYAKRASGDRSDNLWYLMRCLADSGMTVTEIVAVARETVWNKFDGRSDEIKRLLTEATKAIAQRDPELAEKLDDERAPKPTPTRLAAFLADVKKPEWLIKGIATKGSVGFIAGQPKSFKSWFALDMALSVATGARFLDHFEVVEPGPVLYIQEEDSAITVKARTRKIWKGKVVDRLTMGRGKDEVYWEPGREEEFDPDIAIYLQQGFILSEGHWQEWLDETLANGLDGVPFALVIIDTLMNVAGDVEENKAQQMTTKIFKPLKLLARKHSTAVRVVHHMVKSGKDDTRRGGQKMLGSVANHAWSEDSLYLGRKLGKVEMEFESKSAPEKSYTISNLDNFQWSPLFEPQKADAPTDGAEPVHTAKRKPKTDRPSPHQPILDVLAQGGTWSTRDIATETAGKYQTVYRRLKTLEEEAKVTRAGKHWQLTS